MAKKRRKRDGWPGDIRIRICVRAMSILLVARVADPLICGRYPWGPRRNGRSGAWIPGMHVSRRADLIARFLFASRAGGNCGHPPRKDARPSRGSEDTRRVRKLRAPGYGAYDVLAAFHMSLRKYLVNAAESPPSARLRLDVSSFDPCMYFIYRKSRKAAGVISTHTEDILWRDEPDLSLEERGFLEKRFGELRPREGLLYARHGLGPGEGFLCDAEPGVLYEEPEVITITPRSVGRAKGTLVDGLY